MIRALILLWLATATSNGNSFTWQPPDATATREGGIAARIRRPAEPPR